MVLPVEAERSSAGTVATVTLVVVGLAMLAVVLVKLVGNVQPCTVGITGTNASVTVSGWGAGETCTRFVSNVPGGYLRTAVPLEPVICELDRGDNHLIIRDSGQLRVIGLGLCASLR